MHIKIVKTDLTSDLDTLYSIEREVFNRPMDVRVETKEELLRLYGSAEEICFIKGENDKTLGYAAVSKHDSYFELLSIGILPQYQGQGVGRSVISLLLNEYPKNEWHVITHPSNTAALICYLKSGFVIDSWKENYFGEGKHRLLLVRKA